MSCELGYSPVNNHIYREQETRSLQQRKRNILYLIENYLRSENLAETLCCLQQEARLLSEQYTLCDNVDLTCIVQEYEDYFYLRFNKHPKLTRKVDTTVEKNSIIESKKSSRDLKRCARVKSAPAHKSTELPHKPPPGEAMFDNIVMPAQCSLSPLRTLELPLHEYPEEWRPYIQTISQEIVTRDVSTRWSDVIGLSSAKQLVVEAIVYPSRYPELFRGILSPWRGILLHGPPGNGKTLLAKAVATECNTTLFNISASSLVSKWRGDSEKLVRVLFTLARRLAPATIFLDEVDALMSTRDSEDHEASRRLKAELLSQLDGIHTSEDRVCLLATTNVPWDLDPALLRRLEKRILVDSPDQTSRAAMLRHYLPPLVLENPRLRSELDYPALAKAMEGYSGSDIKTVAKEVAMQRMRDTLETLDKLTQGQAMMQMKSSVKLKTITTQQVLATLQSTKPSACADYKRQYEKWQTDFGAT